jgi:hypothetical protein
MASFKLNLPLPLPCQWAVHPRMLHTRLRLNAARIRRKIRRRWGGWGNALSKIGEQINIFTFYLVFKMSSTETLSQFHVSRIQNSHQPPPPSLLYLQWQELLYLQSFSCQLCTSANGRNVAAPSVQSNELKSLTTYTHQLEATLFKLKTL